ncbi:MAG: T9SS type A sorting domain-containing protein [Bacteroidia bacterium]|nr:T9SS type A sorting domain-containing protein [Bacteroidia bacterium]
MRFLLLSICSILLVSHLSSQPTYLKRLSFNSSTVYVYPADNNMQLLSFSECPSGHSIIEIKTTRGSTQIIKLDLQGNIEWEIVGTWLGSFFNSWIAGLHATSDSGVIYIQNTVAHNSSHSYLNKLNSAGILEWTTEVPNQPTPFGVAQESFDIAILADGYACLASDSIFVFDQNGVLKKTYNFGGPGKLTAFSNGDFFLNGQSSVRARFDSSGTIRYTIPGLVVSYDTLIYALTTDSIRLLDGITGNYTSSAYFPPLGANKILMMKDGGWASYSSSRINRYDQSGNLRWNKDVVLPISGINQIGEQSDGSILTGGTYYSSRDYQYYNLDYSSFITTIDTLGNSIVDSISHVMVGDANNDDWFDIGDALYIALAQGSMGPARYDPTIYNYISGNLGTDIAQDFPDTFTIGVNHKHCDYIPDGMIDSLDIEGCAHSGALYGVATHVPLRLRNPSQNISSLLPYFSVLPDQDSATTGDTVRFHFIIGDNGISVDSIFGLAFNLEWDSLGTWDIAYGPWANAMNSDLGSLGNLRVSNPQISMLRNTFLVARRDLQNAYFVQDTIGYMDLIVLDSSSGNLELNIELLAFKAITAGGYPIEFQYNTRPVYLSSLINKTPETNLEKINIYPIPAKDLLTIDNLPALDLTVEVFNVEGKICYSTVSHNLPKLSINLEELSKGFYVVQFSEGDRKYLSRKFVIE